MKSLSWRWRLSFVLILLFPFVEQVRKQVLIVGRWESVDDNRMREEYEFGGRGKIFYGDEITETYRIKASMFLEEQWLAQGSNGQFRSYASPGSGNDPENGHTVSHLYIDILGRRMTRCSKDGCTTFERCHW